MAAAHNEALRAYGEYEVAVRQWRAYKDVETAYRQAVSVTSWVDQSYLHFSNLHCSATKRRRSSHNPWRRTTRRTLKQQRWLLPLRLHLRLVACLEPCHVWAQARDLDWVLLHLPLHRLGPAARPLLLLLLLLLRLVATQRQRQRPNLTIMSTPAPARARVRPRPRPCRRLHLRPTPARRPLHLHTRPPQPQRQRHHQRPLRRTTPPPATAVRRALCPPPLTATTTPRLPKPSWAPAPWLWQTSTAAGLRRSSGAAWSAQKRTPP